MFPHKPLEILLERGAAAESRTVLLCGLVRKNTKLLGCATGIFLSLCSMGFALWGERIGPVFMWESS